MNLHRVDLLRGVCKNLSLPSFVGDEFSFPNWAQFWLVSLISVVGSQHTFEFWSVHWNWSGPRTHPYINFSLVLCVCWCHGQIGCVILQRVQIFILDEGLKVDFCHYCVESSLEQTVSLLYTLTLTHSSIHMTQRFGIQCMFTYLNLPYKYLLAIITWRVVVLHNDVVQDHFS